MKDEIKKIKGLRRMLRCFYIVDKWLIAIKTYNVLDFLAESGEFE